MKIKENYSTILEEIKISCENSNRSLNEVNILAATKGRTIKEVCDVISAGVKICGENYLQDALTKLPKLRNEAEWHFIGHLQSNKVKKVINNFDCVESVDRLKIARKINDLVENKFPIFLEINIGDEESKFGANTKDLEILKKQINELENIEIRGLFCMVPNISQEKTRPYFKEMKILADKLKVPELSMGMSNDYKIAIEEGSNIVRIGSKLFN